MIENFTICVLSYGDHFNLASRCLTSLGKIPAPHLRIGLNAVCHETRNLALQFAPSLIWDYTENRHKYPVMREMIQGVSPIQTPFTMWFDDDSYIDQPLEPWLTRVETAMQQADMLGSLYLLNWAGNQREFVKAQPWYGGKDPAARPKIRFATGGWWTIRTELLYRFDYPWTNLDHRGGDVMLGEMCFQQGLRLKHFNTGVHINADDAGRESRSQRRGFDQRPIGVDFDPGISDSLNRATNVPPVVQPPRPRIVDL